MSEESIYTGEGGAQVTNDQARLDSIAEGIRRAREPVEAGGFWEANAGFFGTTLVGAKTAGDIVTPVVDAHLGAPVFATLNIAGAGVGEAYAGNVDKAGEHYLSLVAHAWGGKLASAAINVRRMLGDVGDGQWGEALGHLVGAAKDVAGAVGSPVTQLIAKVSDGVMFANLANTTRRNAAQDADYEQNIETYQKSTDADIARMEERYAETVAEMRARGVEPRVEDWYSVGEAGQRSDSSGGRFDDAHTDPVQPTPEPAGDDDPPVIDAPPMEIIDAESGFLGQTDATTGIDLSHEAVWGNPAEAEPLAVDPGFGTASVEGPSIADDPMSGMSSIEGDTAGFEDTSPADIARNDTLLSDQSSGEDPTLAAITGGEDFSLAEIAGGENRSVAELMNVDDLSLSELSGGEESILSEFESGDAAPWNDSVPEGGVGEFAPGYEASSLPGLDTSSTWVGETPTIDDSGFELVGGEADQAASDGESSTEAPADGFPSAEWNNPDGNAPSNAGSIEPSEPGADWSAGGETDSSGGGWGNGDADVAGPDIHGAAAGGGGSSDSGSSDSGSFDSGSSDGGSSDGGDGGGGDAGGVGTVV